MTLLLRHEDVAGILSPDEVIAALRDSLREQAAGEVQVPPRITIDSTSNQGWLRLMPAILNRSGLMGYKAMHSTPKVGVRYMVSLVDMPTGEVVALVDADWLTQQRTGSMVAVAADLLANPSTERVGILGSSEQARSVLAAVARVRPFSSVKVFSPTPENRDRFAREAAESYGARSQGVDTPEDAVRGADLVLSAFRPRAEPVLRAEWLSPGAHLSAISSVRPEARELEDAVWQHCAAVVVDDREHVMECGDGRSASAGGFVQPGKIAELWEVVAGQRPGRTSPRDVTLFKSVGTGLQDVALAASMYRRACERGLGMELGDFPHAREMKLRS